MLTARLLTGVVLFGGGGVLSSGDVLSDCQGVELSRGCLSGRSAVVLSGGGVVLFSAREVVLSRGGAVQGGGIVWACCPGKWCCPGAGAVWGGLVLFAGVGRAGGGAVHNRKWHHNTPLPFGQTDRKNITLPQTSFADGNNYHWPGLSSFLCLTEKQSRKH